MYHTLFYNDFEIGGRSSQKPSVSIKSRSLETGVSKKNVDQMTNGNLDQQMAYTICWSAIKSAVTIQERLQNV